MIFVVILGFGVMPFPLYKRQLTMLPSRAFRHFNPPIRRHLINRLKLTAILAIINIKRLHALILKTSLIDFGIRNTLNLNMLLPFLRLQPIPLPILSFLPISFDISILLDKLFLWCTIYLGKVLEVEGGFVKGLLKEFTVTEGF